jgi:AraC-like DNA-binding protein
MALPGNDQMDNPTPMMRNPFAFRDRVVIQGLPHVLDLGLVRDVPGHARRLLDFWVFGMILNGTIGLQIGSSPVRLAKGDYYILPEGVQHFGLDESPFDAAFFHFVLPGGTQPGGKPGVELELHGELPREIDYLELYRFIERHYKRGLLTAEQVGVQLLAVMEQITVIQHHRQLTATASSRYLAGAILDLLQSSYREQLTAKEISRRFGYSYTHLERVFRKEFGMSIHQQLLRVRIDAAAHGLQMGKSIREVATESGFRDYYYFLRAFKRVRGTTPGTFQSTFQATIDESGVRAAERLKARAARRT